MRVKRSVMVRSFQGRALEGLFRRDVVGFDDEGVAFPAADAVAEPGPDVVGAVWVELRRTIRVSWTISTWITTASLV